MQIILLEKVTNLGNLGDVVRVKDGFARNFLIPQRKARRATEAAIADFAVRRAELEKLAAEKLAAAEAVGTKLKDLVLEIGQKAGVDGRLFGCLFVFVFVCLCAGRSGRPYTILLSCAAQMRLLRGYSVATLRG